MSIISLTSLASPARANGDFIFSDPVCITSDYHYENSNSAHYRLDNYRMSRNPGHAMDFDTSGTLHLTYWSGYFATTPTSPAAVYYQAWDETNDWGEPEIVDDSYNEVDENYFGCRMGGRHPSLTVDNGDAVWIAWHDHRDCRVATPYNGINDIEIYCDHKDAGGVFTNTDTRLTDTTSDGIDDNVGDNAYCARIAADPLTNAKSVMWYDFHVDGWTSDIFMATTGDDGEFSTSSDVLSLRLTDQDDREIEDGQTLKPAFNMADFVITPEGQRYAVWSQDFGGSTGNDGDAHLYFATVPEAPAVVEYEIIAENNDGYWFPPKIKLSPQNELWVIYTAYPTTGRQVEALRRRAGADSFDGPYVLADDGRNENADLAIDKNGMLHVAWIDNDGTGNHYVRYMMYDPETEEAVRKDLLTETAGAWSAPCIALNGEEEPYIVFCEGDSDSTSSRGDIWFVRAAPSPNAAQRWSVYE